MSDEPTANSAVDEAPVAIAEAPLAAAAAALKAFLDSAYLEAEHIHKANDYSKYRAVLGPELFQLAWNLGEVRHAARGVTFTLCAYKTIRPAQDVRRHKSEYAGGFPARRIDTVVTVPFLKQHSLTYNVETHWLSQTFSFAGPYERDQKLKTTPKNAGPLLIEVVNRVEEAPDPQAAAHAAVMVMLTRLIDERNRGQVLLEKPKDLAIDLVVLLLERHFSTPYSKNAPRLPQLAIYAIYRCILPSMTRYQGLQLQPLERMKAANRKSGSVGDIDVNRGEQPVEAVEVKHGIPVTREHVAEAVQKIRHASVSRYFILSTSGIAAGEEADIRRLQVEFKRTNGCEIIVNGVLDTVRYYLRLIHSTTDFVFEYTKLVEQDSDLGYEHRLAWNKICAEALAVASVSEQSKN